MNIEMYSDWSRGQLEPVTYCPPAAANAPIPLGHIVNNTADQTHHGHKLPPRLSAAAAY